MALIVLGTLATAIVLSLWRVVATGKNLNSRLGIANWDFSQSWASNLVAVGSLLGVIVGVSGGLPQLNLGLTAVVLSVLFAALIVVGPISYSGLQVNESGTLEGTLGGFYLASGLTLWAALGETVTAGAFFVDLGQKLPPLIVALFFAVVVLAIVMLLRYAWVSMGWVAAQAVAPPPAGKAPATRKLQDFHLI